MRPVPRILQRIVWQSFGLLALSALLAFGVNALRPDGLPLVQAAKPAPSAMPLPSGGEIALKDAALLFLSGRAVFLDARSQFEFEQGHIQGALSLPLRDFAARFPALKAQLGGKEAVITYCDGELCTLSLALAEQLRATGVSNVLVLKNGWSLWQAEKLPVAKGPVGPKSQARPGDQPAQAAQASPAGQSAQLSQRSPAGPKAKTVGPKPAGPSAANSNAPNPYATNGPAQVGLCTDCGN